MHIYIIIAIIAVILSFTIGLFFGKSKKPLIEAPDFIAPEGFNLPYVLNTSLLNHDEILFYKELQPIANKYNLYIAVKPRLADFINVFNPTKHRSFLKMIIAKNVEFLLCDRITFAPVVAFELSFDDVDNVRANRDAFVDHVFASIGLSLYVINHIDSHSLNQMVSDAMGGALNG